MIDGLFCFVGIWQLTSCNGRYPSQFRHRPCRACSETTLKDNLSAESAQSIREVVKPLAHKIRYCNGRYPSKFRYRPCSEMTLKDKLSAESKQSFLEVVKPSHIKQNPANPLYSRGAIN